MNWIIIHAVFLLSLSGCAHRPLPDTHSDAERDGKTAVVLSFDSREGSDPLCSANLRSAIVGDLLVRIEPVNVKSQVPPDAKDAFYFLPPQESGEVWGVLLLDPGSYFLVFTLTEGKSYTEHRYLLDVPKASSGYYVGTFLVDCLRSPNHKERALWSALEIVDHGAQADRVIRNSLGGTPHPPGIVTLSTQPPQDDGTLPAESTMPAENSLPDAVAIFAGKVPLQTPAWRMRAIERAFGGGARARQDLQKDSSPTPLQYAAQAIGQFGGGIVIVMGFVAYAPFGAGYGYLKGGMDQRRYGGCMQDLVQEAELIDLASEARRVLKASLATGIAAFLDAEHHVSATASMTGQIAEIQFERLQLRECQGDLAFCVELSARARIWNAAQKSYTFAETLVYSHPFAFDAARKEVEIEETSGCRSIRSYCGENGRKILHEELSRGVEYLVHRALRDFGLAGETPHQEQDQLNGEAKERAPGDDKEVR